MRDRHTPDHPIVVPGNYGGNAFPRENKPVSGKERSADSIRTAASLPVIPVAPTRISKTEKQQEALSEKHMSGALPERLLPAPVLSAQENESYLLQNCSRFNPPEPAGKGVSETAAVSGGIGSEELLLLGLILLLTLESGESGESGTGFSETALYLLLLLFLH